MVHSHHRARTPPTHAGRSLPVALVAAFAVALCGAHASPPAHAQTVDAATVDAATVETAAVETAAEAMRPKPLDYGLTAVAGLRVGHHRLDDRATGCTVVLTGADGAVAAVDVRGGAPGSRELALLDPSRLVQRVHAIVLAGGSAFGLAAASGTTDWLSEQGIGYDTGIARVPIVPSAILFDLAVGDPAIRPGPDCGRRAARGATDGPVVEGSVGAGAGATVGKLLGMDSAMKAGIGSAAHRLPTGETIAALAATNALGDIIDPATGAVIAGVRGEDGTLADARRLLAGESASPALVDSIAGTNTTLVIVATDAALDQAQAHRLAQMAQDGLARTIDPVHTPFDGDTVFVLATGTYRAPAPSADHDAGASDPAAEPDILRLGAAAATVVADAIVRSALYAEGLPGLPSVLDLASHPQAVEPAP